MGSRALFVLLPFAFLPLACDDNSVGPDTPSPALLWTQIHGGAGDGRFHAVWGANADSLLSLGADHRMLRAHNGAWRDEPLPPTVAGLRALWGRATNDVFAVGEGGLVIHFDGTAWTPIPSGVPARLNDVWGVAAPTVFAVATDATSGAGRVLEYNGTTWTALAGRFDSRLNAVWAEGARGIFVAGENGYAARFDTRGWTPLLPLVLDFAWLDAWGASSDDVFFAGEGGRIGHYHEGVFSIIATAAPGSLWSVSGFAANDVWAVGDGGAMVHFDGTVWSLVPSGTTSTLRAICAFPDGKAVALGDYGTMLLLENGAWRVVYGGRLVVWNGVFCFPNGEAFFAGRESGSNGIARHSDGREWIFMGEEALGLFGFAPDDVYLAGREGSIRHFDGTTWTNESSGTRETLAAIAGALDGSVRSLVAVGERGTIRAWNGVRWGPMLPPANSIEPLYDVWAAAADDVFAVGASGLVLRFRGPPGSLQWSAENAGLTGSYFQAIAGRGPDDVVAASHDGRLFHYNGRAWREMPGATGAPVTAVVLDGRRDGFALAQPRTLLSLRNSNWSPIDIPYSGELQTVGVAGNAGFVAGRYGAILEFRR